MTMPTGARGSRSRRNLSGDGGSSLLEAIVLIAVLAILVQFAAPTFVGWRARYQLRGAAETLSLTTRRLQVAAVATGRAHGIAFSSSDAGLVWQEVVDGDGDGIRRADLRSGIDRPLGPTVRLESLYPDVEAGRPVLVPPLLGGSPGRDGVAFGRSSLLSCSPDRGTSSGTLYLRAGDEAAALRSYGPTGCISLWWWQAGTWIRLR